MLTAWTTEVFARTDRLPREAAAAVEYVLGPGPEARRVPRGAGDRQAWKSFIAAAKAAKAAQHV